MLILGCISNGSRCSYISKFQTFGQGRNHVKKVVQNAGQGRFAGGWAALFNPAFAGVFRHPRLAWGGGGVKRPHVITRERMAAEKRPMWRSKALDETILKHPANFPNEVTCQVKVRSKVKIGAFRLRAVGTSKLSVLGQNLLRVLLKYRARH